MSKLKILVVEDDPLHAAKAEMLLDELDYQLAGIASSEEEAVRMFLATKPDVVLMDIDLGASRDGIEVAMRLNKINPIPIIFATSFADDRTFERAKVTEPYAYLVKPLSLDEVRRNIELAVFRFAKNYLREQVATDHFSGWSGQLLAQDAFFVKTAETLEKVRYAEVLWVEVSSDRYCDIKTASRTFTLRASLKNLEEKLSPLQFMRVHRAYIVNMLQVESINDKDMTLTVAGHTVPMGAVYKQLIVERLHIL
jgi:DNA-binding LytR/AlgR family response regulator